MDSKKKKKKKKKESCKWKYVHKFLRFEASLHLCLGFPWKIVALSG